MAKEIAFENDWICNFEWLVTLTLDGSYCIPSCITHRPPPIAKFHCNRRNSVGWSTYVRTYARTDRHLRLALLGRPNKTRVIFSQNWRALTYVYCINYCRKILHQHTFHKSTNTATAPVLSYKWANTLYKHT